MHRSFPPRFRAAARALLLSSARRGMPLDQLRRALPPLLGAAAFPLSAWRPAVVEGAAAADALFAVFTGPPGQRCMDAMGVEMKTFVRGVTAQPSSLGLPPGLAAALGAAGAGGGVDVGALLAALGGLTGAGGAGADLAGLAASLGLGGGPGPRQAPPQRQPAQPAAAAPPGAANVCAACGATGSLKRCAGCRGVRYCGAACQRAHWRQHAAECRRLRAARG